jgi:chromosome segregation ATPase
MNQEISQLKGQLDRVTKERDTNEREISELTQWKKTAEIERVQLERELKAKDAQVGDLQNSLDKANIDIAVLVPEVSASHLSCLCIFSCGHT